MSEQPTPAQIYEEYLGPAIADPFTRVLLEHAIPQPGERALDVACGTGSVTRQVAPRVGANGKVVALDVNPDMLDVARMLPTTGADVEWLQGDATKLELPDGAFDIVLCQQGLQFFPDRAAALQEMRRVLAPEGRVAISVWRALQLHPLHEALFEAVARHLHAPLKTLDIAFSLSSVDELQTLLDETGFRDIKIAACSLDVRLPTPDRFVQLTMLGAATSVPAFMQLDSEKRSALVGAVTRETEPVVQRYRDDDTLTFPMSTHIAIAYK